jgi:RNA polymerase sigma-70 factor, ECF subfamily
MPNVRRDADRLDADGAAPESPLESTAVLFERIRAGDGSARDALVRRYLPILRRWAHGRLPPSARSLNETDDLVQLTLIKTLNHLESLRLDHPGSFLFYLKQGLLNRVRDEIRSHKRRRTDNGDAVAWEALPAQADPRDFEQLQAYESALSRLPRRQQHLIVMRLEFGMSYAEIARECDCTPDAARMMITRAIAQLARVVA